MLGVQAGGDRQALHEVVRRHGLAVAEASAAGRPNDLMQRLAGDPAFARLPAGALAAELDPARYIGRSPEQVDEFLGEYWRPLRAAVAGLAAQAELAEVTV
jgi:adenylosuccinate lyase